MHQQLNRIRAKESPQSRRIKSCPVVMDAQATYFALTSEQLIGIHRAGGEARFAA